MLVNLSVLRKFAEVAFVSKLEHLVEPDDFLLDSLLLLDVVLGVHRDCVVLDGLE